MEGIIIGKKEFKVKEEQLNQQELVFYVDNPRVYSALRESGNNNPSQEEIETKMRSMEHVRSLKSQIEQNGGLIEALIVVERNGEYIVLEGNSRLAAYRMLAEKDPIKWKLIRCSILPKEITENEIFTLLGTLHLVKKKDWTVYEQAAYVYRQKDLGLPISTLAKSVGLSEPTIRKYINVYEFMVDNKDDIQSHWNYYEQYITNSGIKKYRETYPEMDEQIVTQIKTGKIKDAKSIRDKLGKIAKSDDKTAKKIMRDIIEGKNDIEQGYTRFEATGKSGNGYKKIKEFRFLIKDNDFIDLIKREVAGSDKSIVFELKKINNAITNLLKVLNEN